MYFRIIRTQLYYPGYPSTHEEQDSKLKYHLMRMTNVFNEDKNHPFNEIQKPTDKQVEALREEKINHL